VEIMRRDVSPQVRRVQPSGEVKLVDVGIAKGTNRRMKTRAGIIKGKFFYMSPEQAFGKRLDPRTDVYSAGMVLYELLTNRPAYDDAGDMELLRQVRQSDFAPPSRWRGDLDPGLERIVLGALAADRDQRYPTARALQAALDEYLIRTYGQVSEHQVAEFVRQVTDARVSADLPYKQLMPREDYAAGEDSMIFEAAGPTDHNIFATDLAGATMEDAFLAVGEHEPTTVFPREDDNPFAVPENLDELGRKPMPEPVLPPTSAVPPGVPSEASLTMTQPRRRDLPRPPSMTRASVDTRRFGVGSITSAVPPRVLAMIAGIVVGTVGVLIYVLIGERSQPQPAPDPPVVEVAADTTPEAPPEPAGRILSMTSTPEGASVFLDGALVGTTPMELPELAFGDRHTLALELEDYPRWEQEILVTKALAPVEVDLEELREPDGVLKVVTIPPGLAVEVDGRPLGLSPIEVAQLRRDEEHTIIVVLPNESLRRRTVSWEEGDELVKTVEFDVAELQQLADAQLPDPPDADMGALEEEPAAAKPKPRRNKRWKKPKRKKPKRTTKAPTSKKGEEGLGVWGGAKGSKTEDKSLGVWGGDPSSSSSSKTVGYLTVRVTGGSGRVYINDRKVSDRTPLNRHVLKKGSHKVKVYYPDQKRFSEQRSIYIVPGKARTLTFKP